MGKKTLFLKSYFVLNLEHSHAYNLPCKFVNRAEICAICCSCYKHRIAAVSSHMDYSFKLEINSRYFSNTPRIFYTPNLSIRLLVAFGAVPKVTSYRESTVSQDATKITNNFFQPLDLVSAFKLLARDNRMEMQGDVLNGIFVSYNPLLSISTITNILSIHVRARRPTCRLSSEIHN